MVLHGSESGPTVRPPYARQGTRPVCGHRLPRARMGFMLESNVESKLHKGVLDLGGISYKWAPTTKGLPDRIVFLPGGRVFFIELKQTKGRLSPAQLAIHAKLSKRGTEVVILSGPDEVTAWLDQQKGTK